MTPSKHLDKLDTLWMEGSREKSQFEGFHERDLDGVPDTFQVWCGTDDDGNDKLDEWFWWTVDINVADGATGDVNGPYPTAEGAYLAALGD